jgi:hypothetical protein
MENVFAEVLYKQALKSTSSEKEARRTYWKEELMILAKQGKMIARYDKLSSIDVQVLEEYGIKVDHTSSQMDNVSFYDISWDLRNRPARLK